LRSIRQTNRACRWVPSAQDPELRRIAAKLDIVVDQTQSLQRVINSMRSIGGRIYLLDGVYELHDTLTIATAGIHLVGASNGATVIERTASGSTPLISVTQRYVSIENIRLKDTVATGPAIQITSSHCHVRQCHFENCWRSIYANGGGNAMIIGNRILRNRDTDYSIYLVGTDDAIIANNNIVTPNPTDEIYLDNASERVSIMGNVVGATGSISYLTSSGSRAAGNTPAATGR
jgi:nitrous oxidase accessory protein NosD